MADKAFPDLQMAAHDCLSLNHFLDQIMDPQINFAVKQRCPKTLDEAVAATLEVETPSAIKVGKVTPDEHSTPPAEAVVGAVNRDRVADTPSVSSMLQVIMKTDWKGYLTETTRLFGAINPAAGAVLCRGMGQ